MFEAAVSLRNVSVRSEAFTCLTFQPFHRSIEFQLEYAMNVDKRDRKRELLCVAASRRSSSSTLLSI